MTFIVTAINPYVGVWSAADAAISANGKVQNQQWSKQVVFYGRTAAMALNYTGVARIGRIDTASWLCQQITTWQSHDALLMTLKRAVERRFRAADLRGQPLVICGGALRTDGPPEYVCLTNYYRDGSVQNEFAITRDPVTTTGAIYAHGIGSATIPAEAHRRAGDLIAFAHEKGHPRDYLGLLARLNRLASGSAVSEWCQCLLLHGTRMGGYGEVHVPIGSPLIGPIDPPRMNLAGNDVSYVFARRIKRKGRVERVRRYTFAWTISPARPEAPGTLT